MLMRITMTEAEHIEQLGAPAWDRFLRCRPYEALHAVQSQLSCVV